MAESEKPVDPTACFLCGFFIGLMLAGLLVFGGLAVFYEPLGVPYLNAINILSEHIPAGGPVRVNLWLTPNDAPRVTGYLSLNHYDFTVTNRMTEELHHGCYSYTFEVQPDKKEAVETKEPINPNQESD